MFYFISAIFVLLFLSQCTVVNVLPVSKAKKEKYNSYPYLKDGVQSKSYTVQYIANPYKAFITYDPQQNYFFIAEIPFRKIDAHGKELAKIETDVELDNPLFSHYVFDKEGVYDFSKDPVQKEAFTDIINADFSLAPEKWEKLFSEYYQKAEFVVYGKSMDYKYHPVYLKIDNKWVLFFTSSNEDIIIDYAKGISLEGFPPKFHKMTVLKDPYQNSFSSGMIRLDKSSLEYSYKYPKSHKIQKLLFLKNGVSEHFPYTKIPQEFSGTAYYKLKIKGEILYFKESALKNCLGVALKTYLYCYVLPEQYRQNSELCFLELRYPHNINESGSNGLYIIRGKN